MSGSHHGLFFDDGTAGKEALRRSSAAFRRGARASLRSIEEGLYARRLVIARLQAPDDKAAIQRLELATAGKSRDAETELDVARRIIGWEIFDSRGQQGLRHPFPGQRPHGGDGKQLDRLSRDRSAGGGKRNEWINVRSEDIATSGA
jgi:hypothetical protein